MRKSFVCLVMAALMGSVFLQASCTAQSRDGQSEYRTFTDTAAAVSRPGRWR
jgi:hypothetical protein